MLAVGYGFTVFKRQWLKCKSHENLVAKFIRITSKRLSDPLGFLSVYVNDMMK